VRQAAVRSSAAKKKIAVERIVCPRCHHKIRKVEAAAIVLLVRIDFSLTKIQMGAA